VFFVDFTGKNMLHSPFYHDSSDRGYIDYLKNQISSLYFIHVKTFIIGIRILIFKLSLYSGKRNVLPSNFPITLN